MSSDDDWDTDPDAVNTQTEQEQRFGKAKGVSGTVKMSDVRDSLLQAEQEKARAKSGFERGYGGTFGDEKSGDQTTAAAHGARIAPPVAGEAIAPSTKGAWKPKGTFDDKMAARRAVNPENDSPSPSPP
eukprot:CAMPEP_0180174492 /NCGR_PEP_ID=MMETSP0986-20121125/36183_1 /TAXON_ID=697907 /ORGANISM="non described non described, Strain CCMP2293" /LENGTH=128 /DNA_ID=CAMNT_0022126841 /DNA_START=68 /DNA_END=451 /DNA_ORIENTATION=-